MRRRETGGFVSGAARAVLTSLGVAVIPRSPDRVRPLPTSRNRRLAALLTSQPAAKRIDPRIREIPGERITARSRPQDPNSILGKFEAETEKKGPPSPAFPPIFACSEDSLTIMCPTHEDQSNAWANRDSGRLKAANA